MSVITLHSFKELRVEMIQTRKRKRIPMYELIQKHAKRATEPVTEDEPVETRLREKRRECIREGISLKRKTLTPAVEIMGSVRVVTESEAEELRSAGWTIIYVEI